MAEKDGLSLSEAARKYTLDEVRQWALWWSVSETSPQGLHRAVKCLEHTTAQAASLLAQVWSGQKIDVPELEEFLESPWDRLQARQNAKEIDGNELFLAYLRGMARRKEKENQ